VQRIHVHELPQHVGDRVRVAGWLHHQRRLSRLTFVLLRDRTGIVQVIVDAPELVAEVGALQPESVLEVEALVVRAE
jgi:nondiscriminating aspartyl-tRNA synthetase